ncbi:MAG: choice-of-anchor J domain-containing protein [Owenweeksia sp.]
MKKLVPAILALGLCQGLNAQIFSEDFTNGIPATFNLVDVDGKTPNGNVSFVNAAWVSRVVNGNNVACSNSWYAPPGAADDWMITPAISISTAGTYLVWKAGAPDQNYNDGYEVRISTTGNTVADFTAPPAYTNPGEGAPFVSRVLDLSAYAGQTIYIAFRNNSNDKFLLYVDDLLVDVFSGYDVSGGSVDIQKVVSTGSSNTIKATFTNEAGPFNSADFNYTVNGGAVNTTSLASVNANPTAQITATHTTAFVPSADGAYELKLWLSNIDGNPDGDNTNDTITTTVFATSNPAPRIVVIEEKTGTWCGWCPRGAVGMDYIANKFPNTTIPIAVHNADPMVVAGYDGNNFIGVVAAGGYPGGTVDRTLDTDPNSQALEAAYTERIGVVPTAGVNIKGHTYNASTGAISLDVEAGFFADVANADYRFALVVIEDNVTGTSSGYGQVNYYAGGSNGPMGGYENLPSTVPASQMVYNHVARGIYPNFFGAAGSVPATISFNQTVNYTFNINLPNSVKDDDEVHLAVLLLDNDTYNVLNADVVSLVGGIGIDESHELGYNLFPNPAKDVLNITGIQTGEYEVSLVNSVGQSVKRMTFNGDAQMDVADLKAGIYILQVTADGVTESQRITIVR